LRERGRYRRGKALSKLLPKGRGLKAHRNALFLLKQLEMNTSVIRQQLHEYIDSADDKKIEAMFTLLEAEMHKSSFYSDDELKKFYDRREKYLKGNNPTFTAEESHDYIRK
jgi:uncharacterized protein (UPF0332 family)